MLLAETPSKYMDTVEQFSSSMQALEDEMNVWNAWPNSDLTATRRNVARSILANAKTLLGIVSVIRRVNDIKTVILSTRQKLTLQVIMGWIDVSEGSIIRNVSQFQTNLEPWGSAIEEVE